jgi:hypothetical protein
VDAVSFLKISDQLALVNLSYPIDAPETFVVKPMAASCFVVRWFPTYRFRSLPNQDDRSLVGIVDP